MDFLTKLAIKLMPVVQDPFFKKGCYGLALITVILLSFLTLRLILRKRGEKHERVISDRGTPGITALSILFIVSLSVGILADITEWNEPGKITVLDNGEVITEPKPFFSIGKKKSAVYDASKEISSAGSPERENPVQVEFRDSGTAKTDYKFELKLPEDPAEIRSIHEKFGSQEELIDKGVKPLINEAIRTGAMLLSSEDFAEEKEKKLKEFVNDQLDRGLYIIKEGILLKDDDGNPLRKIPELSRMNIRFNKIRFENFHKDQMVKALEIEKEKLSKELKKLKLLQFEKIPYLNELQDELEKSITGELNLTPDQKEFLLNSIRNTKKILIKIREKRPDNPEPDKKNSRPD